MKNFKKFWLFLFVFGIVFALIGCTPGVKPDPDPDPGEDPITGIACSTNMEQDKCYDPATFDWELNRSKFDGKQMNIDIMVLPVSEYDPFDADYSGDRKSARQEHQTKVEAAYKVKINYKAYPEDAPWGPTRVNWISEAYINQTYRGDIFLIDTNWISTLVQKGAIAELQNTRTNKGLYSDLLKFKQSPTYTQMASNQSKIYAYLPGDARPDHYLYYNQDLINAHGLEDPATLWNEGKWDWSKFIGLLETAQNKFSTSEQTMYAMGGDYAEVVQGLVPARGSQFVDRAAGRVFMTNPAVVQAFTDLQNLYARKMWEPLGSTMVSAEFRAGNVLFNSGSLWFMKSNMRFGPCEFKISAVPYPTLDGDAQNKTSFKIPLGFSAGYAIRPVTNGQNRINSGVILNILDDLARGLKPEVKMTGATANIRYQIWLEDRFDSPAAVDAIMSVQNSKYHQLEMIQTVSMEVGKGSHYPNGFYPFAGTLIRNTAGTLSPQVELEKLQTPYQTALDIVLGNQ